MAARWLGLNRATVRKKLVQYGLSEIGGEGAKDEGAAGDENEEG